MRIKELYAYRLQVGLKMAACYKSIGNAYSAQGDFAHAIMAYQKCVDYYEHMDTQNTEYPKVLLRLAKAEERNKNYEESVTHHKQAMKLFEEHGIPQFGIK